MKRPGGTIGFPTIEPGNKSKEHKQGHGIVLRGMIYFLWSSYFVLVLHRPGENFSTTLVVGLGQLKYYYSNSGISFSDAEWLRVPRQDIFHRDDA